MAQHAIAQSMAAVSLRHLGSIGDANTRAVTSYCVCTIVFANSSDSHDGKDRGDHTIWQGVCQDQGDHTIHLGRSAEGSVRFTESVSAGCWVCHLCLLAGPA
eukprot:1160513-Pelagomonas_calceolata.AAC.16